MPFLENVTRGRNVPRERMLEVAEHYHHFGGVSPINGQVRDLIAALRPELRPARASTLPIYWGNRNWHPMLADTMRDDDRGRRQARPGGRAGGVQLLFELPPVPRGHRAGPATAVGPGGAGGRQDAGLLQPPRLHRRQRRPRPRGPRPGPRRPPRPRPPGFTAHSIPASMADDCDYEEQLTETCRLVAEALGVGPDRWQLVYQSRSGRPHRPLARARHPRPPATTLQARGVATSSSTRSASSPTTWKSSTTSTRRPGTSAEQLGLTMVRSGTVGTHRGSCAMLRELIVERITGLTAERAGVGRFGPSHDVCPVDCCPPPARPPVPRPRPDEAPEGPGADADRRCTRAEARVPAHLLTGRSRRLT